MQTPPSDKEIAIFRGLLELLRQGADLASIKASDIAAAAGLGKGTLYNYFASKDEIIAQAIFFHLEEHFDRIEAGVRQAGGFTQACYAILDYLEKQGLSRGINIHLLLLGGAEPGCRDLMEQGRDRAAALWARLDALGRALAKQGCQEGVLQPQEPAYVRAVVISTLMGYLSTFCPLADQTPEALALAKRHAYRLLVAGLGGRLQE
jgi:AcrR family transcriptional regulator